MGWLARTFSEGGFFRCAHPLVAILALMGGGWNSSVFANCPSTLFTGEIDPPFHGSKDSLYIFARKNTLGKEMWEQIPIQIDQVSQDGRLVFPGEAARQDSLTPTDLILFRTDRFGLKVRGNSRDFPCKGSPIFELSNIEGTKFAYLSQCPPSLEKKSFPFAAKFEPDQHLLESYGYKYRFNRANYLQFDNIEFLNPNNIWEQIAQDSRMLIRSDVRRFFTMHFDSKQIESKLEKSRLGPVADLARLSFFLRILFFRLDISLSTDVAFFDDAGHIPMMINVPVHSHEWLNPRSGILYTWVLSEKARTSPQFVSMPILDVGTVKKGWQELGKKGVSQCHNEDCRYNFGVTIGGRHLVMDFNLKRSLVERGFFPLFVNDVAAYKDAMDWQIETPPDVHRIGMYFEVSGLPKGGHPWNFWLKLGGQEAHDQNCPAPYLMKLANKSSSTKFGAY